MILITDNPSYAIERLLSSKSYEPFSAQKTSSRIESFANLFCPTGDVSISKGDPESIFSYLFIKQYSEVSQFDQLIHFCSEEADLTEGILCFSGSGNKFHGFHQREWVSVEGNIHLSLSLNPHTKIDHTASAFLIVAANAVVQTINGLDRIQERARLHWVNDIVINGLKVGGVLCQTQMCGEITERVILGIGLNVCKKPEIVNDLCVRGTTAINQHVKDENPYRIDQIFWPLVENIEKNYTTLLSQGYRQLLAYYRENSDLIGKSVTIFSDPRDGQGEKLAEGRVENITDNLEILLEGESKPLRKGRVSLID